MYTNKLINMNKTKQCNLQVCFCYKHFQFRRINSATFGTEQICGFGIFFLLPLKKCQYNNFTSENLSATM